MGTSFEILNEILQGEHRSIKQYQAYIDALPESPLRNHLVAFVTDHKKHATRLAYFIQTNGGHVKENLTLSNNFAIWQARLKNLWENKPLEMLEDLYTEEDNGLSHAIKIYDNLCSSEKEILEPMIADEKSHLKQLERLKDDLLE